MRWGACEQRICEIEADALAQSIAPYRWSARDEVERADGVLPVGLRRHLERSFGAGFEEIRIHADAASAIIAERLGALAFTVGADIVFAPDQYQPETVEGQRLIAHELVHVAQQAAATFARVTASIRCRAPRVIQSKSKAEEVLDAVCSGEGPKSLKSSGVIGTAFGNALSVRSAKQTQSILMIR